MSNALAAMPVYANVKWTAQRWEIVNVLTAASASILVLLGSKVKKADTNVAEATNN